jgi:hypothetical protein
METARPFAPEPRSRDRLRFGFRPDKPGKRPGFTDSTGEYRDTRTGWLGREDSNLRMPESKSGALPLGYAPIINELKALAPPLLPNLLPKAFCLTLAGVAGARAYSRSERAVEFGSGVFLHRCRDVAVEIECCRDRRMAKPFLRDLRMHPS